MKENKVIDVTNKKITIIKPGREVTSYIDQHATLDIIDNLSMDCAHLDPFGLDTVIDCLSCPNSDYKIVLHGKVMKDFNESQIQSKKQSQTRYVIEFFDKIPSNDELVSYLEDDNSNYRITRDEDGVILRYSIEDKRKSKEKYKKIQGRSLASYIESDSKDNKESIVKKKTIFSKIFGKRK